MCCVRYCFAARERERERGSLVVFLFCSRPLLKWPSRSVGWRLCFIYLYTHFFFLLRRPGRSLANFHANALLHANGKKRRSKARRVVVVVVEKHSIWSFLYRHIPSLLCALWLDDDRKESRVLSCPSFYYYYVREGYSPISTRSISAAPPCCCCFCPLAWNCNKS